MKPKTVKTLYAVVWFNKFDGNSNVCEEAPTQRSYMAVQAAVDIPNGRQNPNPARHLHCRDTCHFLREKCVKFPEENLLYPCLADW